MKWSTAFVSLSIAVSLVAACGTAGLGVSAVDGSVGSMSGKADGGGRRDTGTSGDSTTMTLGGGDAGEGGIVNQCVPKTCATLGVTCGPQGDGCGGVVQCGNCVAPATCGGGGMPSQCGGNNGCKPKTCADLGVNCGPAGDGCGGILQCGTCTGSETCGGGGTPSVCGGDSGCVPKTCASEGVNCGPIGDGCGNVVQCGNCGTPQTCGGGGKPSVCGDSLVDAGDSGVHCVAKTCAELGINCGPAGDGCGHQLACGSCTAPATCGGGGTPSKCGGTGGCTPKTCAQLGLSCGPAGDGCGGELDCGTCTAPKTCGGGGTPSVCGGSNDCVPKTCAELGFNCGPAGDGCGGMLNCGSMCPAGEICGGGVAGAPGSPGVCGPPPGTTGGCTGLCLQQMACANPHVTTTISGTVYAPNGTDPLYNALVYVPNGGPAPNYGVTAFAPGVACVQCGSEVSGSPLVSTNTAPDGTFQLQNVPVGANIPLVIQLGRWRRMITIPSVTACTNTALTAAQTSLPSEEGMGSAFDNIPLIAFSTGAVDGLECVFLKIGINQNQFSDPAAQGGSGRIRFYLGEGAAGAQMSMMTPVANQLWGEAAGGACTANQNCASGVCTAGACVGGTPDIDQYDMVFFPCQGGEYQKTTGEQTEVINYANAGGRVFGTHYSYVWDFNDSPFSTTATWQVNQGDPADQTGYINTSFARGQALAQWLQITGSSTTYGQMPLNTLRHDFNNVVSPSLLWVSLGAATIPPGTVPMHYTFDTPVGNSAATQCGRVLFDDFHVYDLSANESTGKTFPAECPAGAMTPQEKMLEFMIFDLSSCIIPTVYVPPTCTPETCAAQGFNCGPAGDGCGNELACGTCTPPKTCGGGGTPGVCGGTPCVPVTCGAEGIQCGPAGDGCGNLLECGNCPNGETCGGGGIPGKCAAPPMCTPVTCSSQNIACGPAGDGCGNLLECGNCPAGEACSGSKCVAPDASACKPLTCAAQNISCGPAGNGCGGQLACGTCTPPETCGGGGMPGVCGQASCTPTTCEALGFNCGPAGNGCGGQLACGTCPTNQSCGGGGTPGVCGSSCVPATCASLKLGCGPAGDGCGGLLECGTCTAPDTCGGGGVSGQCGNSGPK